MSSSKQKVFSGAEFNGSDTINLSDVSDWVVDGLGGEAAKTAIDDFDWDGNIVAGITLHTSPDNKKVVGSNIFLTGDFMKSSKEIKANRLFAEADKDMRIVYTIEDASIFSFKTGTLIGDMLEDASINWSVGKKTGRAIVDLEESDYETNNIGHFVIRPYLVPLSSSKMRLTVMAYPMALAELELQHPLCKKAAFPGLELIQCDVDIFPLANKETGKAWGCPLVPLLYFGGDQGEYPQIPPTSEMKAAISAVMRAVVMPVTKRDLRTLSAAWAAIKESGPSKLKEKTPDTMWPLWTAEAPQHGN